MLSARGPSLFLPLVAQHLGSRFDSFDALVRGAPEAVREAEENFGPIFEHCMLGSGFDLVLVGWSEARDRGETYSLTSIERPSQPPWVMRDMGNLMLSPFDADLEPRVAALGRSGRVNMEDPVALGIAIMEEQRGVKAVQAPGYAPAGGVGGICQMTTLTRDTIETRVVHRWPDRIGKPLGQDLTPMQREAARPAWTPPGPAAAPAAMTRQQRRAEARQTRGRPGRVG